MDGPFILPVKGGDFVAVPCIRVNAISPGGIATEGTHAAGLLCGDFDAEMVRQTPLGRFGQTDEIAPVAVSLASDDARWVTGETIVVSGSL